MNKFLILLILFIMGFNYSDKAQSVDYPGAIAKWAPSCNTGGARSTSAIDTWVNHWIGVGTYLGSIDWFLKCPGSASGQRGYISGTSTLYGASSAHFIINTNGEVTQVVPVNIIAYHTGASGYPNNNTRSIGVEHTVTASDPSKWNNAILLQASVDLASYFCNKFNIPKVYALPGIRGHKDMPGTSTVCPGTLPWTTWLNMLTNGGGGTTAPTNDNCPGTSITSNGLSLTGTVAGATGSYGANLCDGCGGCAKSRDDNDVYYYFTAIATSHTVTVSNYASNFDAVIELRTDCALNTSIGCWDPSGTPTSVSHPWGNLIIGKTYYIRVYEFDYSLSPPSSPTFNISVTHTTTSPTLTVTSPNGGENWQTGTTQTITWNSTGVTGNVQIQPYLNGVAQNNIVTSASNTGSYNWTIPSNYALGTTYKIGISAMSGTVSDFSNSSFTISSPTPTLTVSSPNGGENWQAGTSQTITWNSTGVTGNVQIQPYLNGVAQNNIVTSASNTGSYNWTIPSNYAPGTTYKIGISAMSGTVADLSNSNFTISAPTSTLTVSSPNGGENWQAGTSQTITWNSTGVTGNVQIQPYLNGVAQNNIVTSASNTGSYNWTIPSNYAPGTTYKIGISAMSGTVSDFSNSSFTISAPTPSLTVSPSSLTLGATSGSNEQINVSSNVSWTASDDASWLSVSPTSGSNNGIITVTATSANELNNSRSGTLTIIGSGITKNVTVTQIGVTTPATITTSQTSLPDFGSLQVDTYSTPQNFTVSGNNLSSNISLTATGSDGFQISTSSSSGFGSTVTLTPSGGTVSSTPIYVRFNPSLIGSQTGNISVTSTGAASKNVSVSGTGTSTPTATITASQTSLPDFGSLQIGTSSSPQNYTVSGSNLSTSISLTTTGSGGFQISTSSSSGFGSTVTLTPSGGSVSSTPIYVRFMPSLIGYQTGNISVTSTGAASKNVSVSGTGTGINSYCSAGSTSADEYLSNVKLGTINQTSGLGTSGYQDFTSQSTTLKVGVTASIEITAVAYAQDQILIWVDWNQDKDFLDVGENIYSGIGNLQYLTNTIDFTVPADAKIGTTRMRIRLHDTVLGPNATSCGNSEWGEVEDYILNITSGIANLSAPTSCTVTLGDPANGLEHILNLNCSLVTGADGYSYEYSWDGVSWTINWLEKVENSARPNTNDSPNLPIYFRVRAYNSTPHQYSNYTYASPQPIYTACDEAASPIVNGATSNSLNVTLNTETPVANPAITTYSIYCTTISQYVQTNGTLGSTEVFQTKSAWGTKTVTGLLNNKEYCFYAKAKNSGGDIRFNPANTSCGTTVSGSPFANFSASPLSDCTPLTVTFTDESTGTPTSWAWDIDNNGVTDYTVKNPTHTYSIAGTYSVKLTVANASGSNTKTANSYITAKTSVTPSVSINANPLGAICTGQSVSFTATPTNGGTSPSYQWKKNGTNVSTGISYTSSSLVNGDVITCVMTSNSPCAIPAIATSTGITMQVNSTMMPSVSISADQLGAISLGQQVIFTATPTNGGSAPKYQWKVNGINIGDNNPTYTTASLTNGQIVSCVITSNSPCASSTVATSNSITMVVGSAKTTSVEISIITGSNPTCAGESVTFKATPVNGGTSPSFLWKLGSNTIGVGDSFSSNMLSNGQVITCEMTSNDPSVMQKTVTSNSITINVNSLASPGVSIAASPTGAICAGQNVSFTAIPINGGTSPSYQWKRNGLNVSTSATYSSSNLVNGEVITCAMTSNSACVSPLTAYSNSIVVSLSNTVVPGISINANPSGTICSGQSVSFTATPNNGGTSPGYQWKRNGSVVSTSPTYSSSSHVNGDVITCVMTSNLSCTSPSTATSNAIVMSVNNSNVTALPINITAGSNPTCTGQTITYNIQTVTGTNNYIWTLPQGANGSSTTNLITVYYTSLAKSGDLKVKFTDTCGEIQESALSVIVNNNPPTPIIKLNGSLFESTPANGYQWYCNNKIIPNATNQTLSPTQGGDYYVVVVNNNCSSLASNSLFSYPVGNEVIRVNELIKVYPNPTSGIITIEGLSENQKSTIAVYADNGILILKKTTYSRQEEVDISNQVSGYYLLIINKQSVKIIKK